jgi:branched-chain amino acid transport system substrate-binding protein
MRRDDQTMVGINANEGESVVTEDVSRPATSRRARGAALLLLAACCAVVVACGGDDEGSGASKGGGDDAVTEVPIGVIEDLSGANASQAFTAAEGVRMAADEVNKKGFEVAGKKYKLKVLQKDTRTDPSVAVSSTQELVRDNGISALFGTELGTGLPAIPISQKAGILHFISSGASEAELEKPENCCLFRSSLANKYRDPTWFKAAVESAQKADPSLKTMATIFPSTQDFRKVIVPNWVNSAKTEGLSVVATKYFAPGTTDFSGIISSLASSKPDILLLPPTPPEAQALIRQAVEQKVAKAFFVPAVPADIAKQAVGHGIDQPVVVMYTGAQFGQPTTDATKQFIERYKAWRGGKLPEQVAESSLFFYDSVHQYVAAMEKAGCVPKNEGGGGKSAEECSKKLVGVLTSTPYEGVRGTIQYDATHRVKYPLDVCTTVQDDTTCQTFNP